MSEINVDQAFEEQFLRLSSNLTTSCKIQEIKGSCGDSWSAPFIGGRYFAKANSARLVITGQKVSSCRLTLMTHLKQ